MVPYHMIRSSSTAVDWFVTIGTARRGLAGAQPAQAPPRWTKCNCLYPSSAYVPITVFLWSAVLMCKWMVKCYNGLSTVTFWSQPMQAKMNVWCLTAPLCRRLFWLSSNCDILTSRIRQIGLLQNTAASLNWNTMGITYSVTPFPYTWK